jgi:hypothetical protein
VALIRGLSLKGTVIDPDGKPLAGTSISGLKDMAYWSDAGPDFTVESLQPNEPRVLQFMHKRKKLAGVWVLRGDEKEPIAVRLQPWGAFTGRLVSPRGEPLSGARVSYRVQVKLKGENVPASAFFAETDKDGRFRIEGLAPGLTYHNVYVLKRVLFDFVGEGARNLTLKAGETRDLGDLTIKPRE